MLKLSRKGKECKALVIGDNGKMYVPAELTQIYREEIVPLATMLTPNQFEVAAYHRPICKTECPKQ
jgi:pyridoxal/pyridoxine/pyridoxamine kinase